MEYIELAATVWGLRNAGRRVSLEGWGVKGRTATAGGLSCLVTEERIWSWPPEGTLGDSSTLGCCPTGLGLFPMDVTAAGIC